MVIVSPILERDDMHGDTLHNTAGKLRQHIHFIENNIQQTQLQICSYILLCES